MPISGRSDRIHIHAFHEEEPLEARSERSDHSLCRRVPVGGVVAVTPGGFAVRFILQVDREQVPLASDELQQLLPKLNDDRFGVSALVPEGIVTKSPFLAVNALVLGGLKSSTKHGKRRNGFLPK